MLEQKLSYSQNAAKRVSTYLAVQTYEGDKNGTRHFFFFFFCMSDSSGIVLSSHSRRLALGKQSFCTE